MGHDELFGVILSELLSLPPEDSYFCILPVQTGYLLSGCRDLNSGPSVPQIDAPQTADLHKRPETASGLPFWFITDSR